MKRRITYIIYLALLACISLTAKAQTDDEEFPEETIMAETDSLLAQYMAKTYLQVDSTCQMGDVNPVYDEQDYINRLQRLPAVIELPYNDIVRQHIDRYTSRGRRAVSYMLGAANFYVPFFEEALEALQLPLELKYLPVVESSLNPIAVSPAGASGLWQFMPIAAKQYGLQVNSLLDERRDPVKSSQAAARLLRDLYKLFGDWHLAIAAYNCGPENVNKAIHRAGGERDYWKIYPYLPHETRGYVPAFIAACYVMNYYCEHNICPMRTNLPAKTDTVMLSQNIHLQQVAAVMQLNIEMLRGLNPELRRDIVPGASAPTALRLPAEETARFIDLQDSIAAYQADQWLNRRAVVTPASDPVGRGKSSRNSRSKSRRSGSGGKSVTVRSGQTLSSIAASNGVSVAQLRKLNGIKGSNIRAGQKLRVK